MTKSQPTNPIIVAGRDQDMRDIVKRAIARVTHSQENTLFTKNIESALGEVKALLDSNTEVDMVITDVFLGRKFNIFTYVREMELIPSLRNIPLLIYTKGMDEDIFNKIRKDIVHLPFRVVIQGYSEQPLEEASRGLLEYKRENRHYLELEEKMSSLLRHGDDSVISTILEMIDEYAEKYPKVLLFTKVQYLKGEVYYEFWKRKTSELEPLDTEIKKFSPSDKEYKKIERKIIAFTRDRGDYLFKAENHYLGAYQRSPRYWKNLYALYNLYMGQNDLIEAKKYLTELIKIFPEQSKYFFRLGKIDELEGNFNSSVKNYLSAWQSFAEEDLSEYEVKNVMEVIDASLESSKKILNEMALSKLSTQDQEVGSREYILIRTLKQNNAMTRKALVHISKKVPNDPNVFNKIGITYRRTGDYQMAMEMYSQALEIEPGNHRIRMNYSVALALFDLWEKAKKELQTVKRHNRDKEDDKIIDRMLKVVSNRDGTTLGKMLV